MVDHRFNSKKKSTISSYRNPLIFSGGKIPEEKRILFSPSNLKYLLYFAIVALIVYFFFYSSKFAIKDVIVEGNSLVPAEDLVKFAPQGKNIFLFNPKKTEAAITQQHSEIGNVQIYRGIPNAIKIVVLERDGKMVWQTSEGNYLISSQGEVARKIVGEEGKDLPVVTDLKNIPVQPGQKLVSPNFIAFINNIYSQFFEAVNIHPLGFEVSETTFDVNLKTDAGFYVKLNSLRSSKKQLDNLKAVLVAHRVDVHEYIDLRIDGWAYYK